MTSPTTIISVYAVLLLAALLAPYASIVSNPFLDRYWSLIWSGLCGLLLVGAIILTIARGGHMSLLCVVLLLPLVGFGTGALLGGVTAVLLFVTVTWWTKDLQLSVVSGCIFVVLALFAGWLPRWGRRAMLPPQDMRLRWFLLLFTSLGLFAGLLTAPFEAIGPIQTVWHHWSAYLSPVEAWRGGGAPYRDFPIQYGLGPTALLRLTCGSDCWRGMYVATIVANALYFATLAGSVVLLTVRTTRGLRRLALAALFCASFIWTGFPVEFAGPAMTPSVAGLRFLSISALLFHILLAERRKIQRDWVGHAIWLLSLFWSCEAGAFATLIWWPYLALRDAGLAKGRRDAIVAFISGAVRGGIAVVIGAGALILTLWLWSEGGITAADFFAYIQHPPGVMPVNPAGTLWIALAPVALALPLLARQGLSHHARPLYACLIGFGVAGTYYISRSHDNNILNLFPLLILLLLAISTHDERAEHTSPDFAGAFVRVTLAAMVAFVATFNFGPWNEGVARQGLLTFGPSRLLSRLTPASPGGPADLSPDGVAGMRYARARTAGMVMLFDSWNVMPREPGSAAWTGVNNVANFAKLPRAMTLRYIQRGALAYHRSGWILADAKHREWVENFKIAYDVRERRSFGTYEAYYLVPRVKDATSN